MANGANPPRPTDAELEILTVLWSIGPATVRQVYESLNQRRRAQYSTTLKFMQIMVDKGLLLRDDNRRAHVYQTTRPREWTQQQLAGHLLDRGFNGSAKALLIGVLSVKKISEAELAEIRKFVNEHEKRAK